MKNTNGIRLASVLLLKELIWFFLCKHAISDKKNIFLYSSRRGGSTLLMEVIASDRAINFSDQPFGLYTITPWNLKLLPLFEYSQIISLDKDEEELIKKYVENILTGKIYANSEWKFWRKGGLIKTNRIVLKITDAKNIINFLEEQFNPYTLIMTRHPIPQSLSVIRNGWECTGKAFIRNEQFREIYLSSEKVKYCKEIYNKGTKLQRHVLDWGLENLVMLKGLSANTHWKFISFEHLVLNPLESVAYLSSSLRIDHSEHMIKFLDKPSKSTKLKSNLVKFKKLAKQDKVDLVTKWKDNIPDSVERSAMDILSILDLKLYTSGNFSPSLQNIGCSKDYLTQIGQ
ncbi:MAG: hypothetical protein D3920_00120 [Candidatus Electrothrix sp. AW2]|nr:hypothetical protein [Candidatus Electrothrix gigas]MCI5225696.1 hypothetical protein [Candidatus Electrothrix gigas]